MQQELLGLILHLFLDCGQIFVKLDPNNRNLNTISFLLDAFLNELINRISHGPELVLESDISDELNAHRDESFSMIKFITKVIVSYLELQGSELVKKIDDDVVFDIFFISVRFLLKVIFVIIVRLRCLQNCQSP